MKPVRVPGDGAKVAKRYLAAVLPELAAALPGRSGEQPPTVGLDQPTDWTANSPHHVAVFDDSGPALWPVATMPRLRVVVWTPGRDLSRELAGLCLGVLLAHRIPGLAVVRDPTGLLEATDKNGSVVVSFTVATVVRTAAAQ